MCFESNGRADFYWNKIIITFNRSEQNLFWTDRIIHNYSMMNQVLWFMDSLVSLFFFFFLLLFLFLLLFDGRFLLIMLLLPWKAINKTKKVALDWVEHVILSRPQLLTCSTSSPRVETGILVSRCLTNKRQHLFFHVRCIFKF